MRRGNSWVAPLLREQRASNELHRQKLRPARKAQSVDSGILQGSGNQFLTLTAVV